MVKGYNDMSSPTPPAPWPPGSFRAPALTEMPGVSGVSDPPEISVGKQPTIQLDYDGRGMPLPYSVAGQPWEEQLADDNEFTVPMPSLKRPSVFSMAERGWQGAAQRSGRFGGREWVSLLLGIGAFVVVVSVLVAVVLAQALSAGGASSHSNTQASLPAQSHVQLSPTATTAPTPTVTVAPPSIVTTFVTLDTSTQGSWQGVYGAVGYAVVADTQQLPSTIQVTPNGASEFTWAASTTDPRAVQKPSNPADRVAACWYSNSSFTIDVNITDGQTYQMALYLLDWDQQSRVEAVSVLDPTTGAVLDTHNVAAFADGQYLVWNVRGHVTLQITNQAGSINAVVGGIFFASV